MYYIRWYADGERVAIFSDPHSLKEIIHLFEIAKTEYKVGHVGFEPILANMLLGMGGLEYNIRAKQSFKNE